ncbi:hypothetical protein TVAG_110300 [Trichomonas vaginalis G3]|uniref:Uncharacterized protein n=1 Tax=Trichomonas vaginalis (strain ATCC PRA-98 / G3) TaxID=412133 RepID=A2DGN1_TRIV3|nr:hypothetical protein TVAGG3_0997820 [Trichomonas vaginalis G3]EAY20418.1 hypothetical protein TVAG_110300 [Trichomonas vaginalis G3]KAI5490536.1 hypothetical protein TVAGG3_0997820 [Trichomonas vaginalis G3]|eukprot:XP_001581404.1 hypothetical protein [Trichomonas vaginalis G3]
MILISLFAQKAVCDNAVYADILNEKGFDIATLSGEGYPRIRDFMAKDMFGNYSLRQLILDSINLFNDPENEKTTADDLEKIYHDIIRYYTDNATEIKDLLPQEAWENKRVNLVSMTFPHFAPFLKEKGYNTSEIQKCIDNVKDKKGTCQYKDIARLLKLSPEFYFNISDKVGKVMTGDAFKIQDVATTIYLNTSNITDVIKDVPSIFKKGRANVAEMGQIAFSAFKLAQGFYNSSKTFLGKAMHSALQPYVSLLPRSVKEMRQSIELLVQGYESLIKDPKFTEKELEFVTKYIVNIYNDFKRQLRDETILVPQGVKKFLLENIDYFDPSLSIYSLIRNKKVSIFDAYVNGTQDLITPAIHLLTEDKTKFIEWFDKITSVIRKYYDENTPVSTFQMDWLEDVAYLARSVKEYPSTMKINDILAKHGMNKMNAQIVKSALLNISSIFNEITVEDYASRTLYTILRKMADATKDDATIVDYVKCLPFGESLAMYYKGLDNYNQGKSLKDAFWDWEFEGMYVMRTFEAWKTVKVPSIKNLAKAIVTVNATGVQFVNGTMNLYTKLIKNGITISRNEISNITGGFVKRILDYAVPIAAYNTYNVSAYFQKLTDVNITNFAYTVQKLAKQASTGGITWEQFTDFNKKVDEELLQPISAQYDEETKQKLAAAARRKKLIIIICASVGGALVIGAAVLAFVLYRNKSNKSQDTTPVNTAATLI